MVLAMDGAALAGCTEFEPMAPASGAIPKLGGRILRIDEDAESMTIYKVRSKSLSVNRRLPPFSKLVSNGYISSLRDGEADSEPVAVWELFIVHRARETVQQQQAISPRFN